ncbi:hypothetical protein [Kribbella solani]|uniref:Uncharacterized protein n=1 Tax=Kribbella solani TaxID=236067 RepID=A0A841DZT0_9ACTN|nr:hypothetical protein [Kribbella solani]MBB5983481.1 hypothetical protein [Kribbella solani]
MPNQATGAGRPRAMVIDHAWRDLGPGLESLSGPGGAPLTRTVKLIVLPLIVRPALHPELATDFLAPDQAARLNALIVESAGCLAATAHWFTLLKKARRALGVVAGNPQDLYFQRCYELATEHGAPPSDAETIARTVVQEIADDTADRTVEALRNHLTSTEHRTQLDAALIESWAARALLPQPDAAAVIALADEVLDSLDDSVAYAAMVAAGHGELFGQLVWTQAGGVWGSDELPTHLGLTVHPVPVRPEVGRSASTATLPAPLDRTLFDRLFVVLQSSTRRDELPPVPTLVSREVSRSSSPLGLSNETLRVAATLGARLASGLDPLGVGGGLGLTAAHRTVNSRWRREASVLRARRMTVSPDPDGGVLNSLAQDLRTPWSAYMRRLWVRLHGRDVRDAPLPDLPAAWTVLDGVARSVMMDHRARVRAALRTLSATTADPAESRSA